MRIWLGVGVVVVGCSSTPIAGAAACGLRSTSMPVTGPWHVVPVKGTRSVLPLSSSVPFPLSEIAQFALPGIVAVPLTEMVTVVPLS